MYSLLMCAVSAGSGAWGDVCPTGGVEGCSSRPGSSSAPLHDVGQATEPSESEYGQLEYRKDYHPVRRLLATIFSSFIPSRLFSKEEEGRYGRSKVSSLG